MPQATAKHKKLRRALTRLCVIALCLMSGLSLPACRRTNQAPPSPVASAEPNPLALAISKVEAERSEPIGREASVAIPVELKHYRDRRRFLAVQAAEFRKQRLPLPLDYADLVDLIGKRQFVELKPLDGDYLLYGVGAGATDEAFAHYDLASGKNVPLFATEGEYKTERERLEGLIKEQQAQLDELARAIKATPKRDRAQRKALTAQAIEQRRAISEIAERKQLLEAYVNDSNKRRLLAAEYRKLAEFAASFQEHPYDLNDATERRALKMRLLCYLRPQARDVLTEIARAYNEKFNRPLPITSLVRHAQYQKQLSETNPNAARNAAPPHTSGLAFDVYYHFMTAAEQDYLMGVIARLKADGRIEALRETRDHIHVFAFTDGHRPDEKLIAQQINQAGSKSRR